MNEDFFFFETSAKLCVNSVGSYLLYPVHRLKNILHKNFILYLNLSKYDVAFFFVSEIFLFLISNLVKV